MIVVGLLAVLFAAVSPAATISLDPAYSVARVGDSVTVDLWIADVDDLYAYGVDITFDPTVLAASTISESTFLTSGGNTVFSSIQGVPGVITLAHTLLGPVAGVSGRGPLASVSFISNAVGVSPLGVSNLVLLNSSSGDIEGLAASGAVTVEAAVPEPVSLLPVITAVFFGVVVRLRPRRCSSRTVSCNT